jgi:hypothetical protein
MNFLLHNYIFLRAALGRLRPLSKGYFSGKFRVAPTQQRRAASGQERPLRKSRFFKKIRAATAAADSALRTDLDSHAAVANAHREHASLEESADIAAAVAAHAALEESGEIISAINTHNQLSPDK